MSGADRSGPQEPLARFGDYQRELYLAAPADRPQRWPLVWAELEAAAHAAMGREIADYVAGGAGAGRTMRANLEAFDRWRIVPRVLRGPLARDLRVTVCGTSMAAPVLLAPVGVLGAVHPGGEGAVARAAASLGLPMVLSTAASTPIEEVAAAGGEDGPRWFQLYWPGDRELAASLVRRAEQAGFGALVVTLDTRMLGWRPLDLQHGYLPFLRAEGLANYLTDPAFRASLAVAPEEDPEAAVRRFLEIFADPTLTWDDLGFLRTVSSLPVLLKGVLHPRDARRALDAGMDGVIVSNHGGRQVDGAVAALDALPAVVKAVAGACPVLLDSGVRTGADALKALALGAEAVLLGRPYVWGLALDGEQGVLRVLRAFLAELDITLTLSGYATPGQLSPEALAPAP